MIGQNPDECRLHLGRERLHLAALRPQFRCSYLSDGDRFGRTAIWSRAVMISCSHWGMFPGRRYVGSYMQMPIYECDDIESMLGRGFEIVPGQDVQAELRRPDGMVMIKRRPPFRIRLRNYYRMYRKNGMSRWGALRNGWRLARV